MPRMALSTPLDLVPFQWRDPRPSLGVATKALLRGLIDYAAIFPPARLGVTTATERYLSYHSGSHGHLLGAFLCDAPSLAGLDSAFGKFRGRVDVGLVVRELAKSPEGVAIECKQLQELITNQWTKKSRWIITQFEVAPPKDAFHDLSLMEATIDALRGVVIGSTAEIFIETPFGTKADAYRDVVELAVRLDVGIKVRTVRSNVVVESSALAAAVYECVHQGVPFKATAGLHDAFPTLYVDHEEPPKHGFVPLFLAGAVASVYADVDIDALEQLIRDTGPADVKRRGDDLAIRGYRLNHDQIEQSRRIMRSFGACKFRRPIQGLQEAALV